MKIRIAWASATFIFVGSAVFAQPAPNDSRIRSGIDTAYKSMVKTWAGVLGSDFVPPRIVYYTKPTKTGCGEAGLGNAFFCHADNAIYIDTGFIATVDKFAATETGSSGDYAGITVVAHEFGHAVERHTSYQVMPTSEAAADCFAGAETRQVKADGGLAEHSFDEALAFMEFGGDDKVIGFNPNNSAQVVLAWAIYGPLNHGVVEQRQEAFLRGFYGGADFCTDGLGSPSPSAGGKVIAFQPLVARQLNSPAPGCFLSAGRDGVEMRNVSARNGCVVNLLPPASLLPDHVRIELTVKLLPSSSGHTGSAGIYYGDARPTGKLVRFGDETNEVEGTKMINLDGNPPVADPPLSDLLLIRKGANPGNGDQVLTLDIHHEGKNVYFIEYLNGVAVEHNALWRHGTQYRRFALAELNGVPDQAGLLLRQPGSVALFSNFRVSALPN